MRRAFALTLMVCCAAFGAGQLSVLLAAGTPYQAMDCAPVTRSHGFSSHLQGFETFDEVGYCYGYYLDGVWVVGGSLQYYPYPGWTSASHGWRIYNATSVFATHHVTRDWYNGYVGTSDY